MRFSVDQLATLHLEGRTYTISACQFGFHQPTDHRGRPRSRVRTQPIYLLLYPLDGQHEQPLLHWALNSYKLLSGKVVFSRADSDSALKYLWFTNARAELSEQFDATGAGPGAALQLWLRIWAEEAGVEPGSGGQWVAPAPHEYAAPVAAVASAAAAVAKPGIPPHLPAPWPQPSPDHQQVHLSQQEWDQLIKGRWDSSVQAKNKRFFKRHRQSEFHVAGDPFTYRTDAKGRMQAVYDAHKSYNVTGSKNGLMGIPLTLNGQPTYADTPHMYPVSGSQKNVVVIEMTGNRAADFKKANESAGLADVIKAQGRAVNKPPEGYTWHHRDDFIANSDPPPYGTCTMELVRVDAHEDTFVHYGSCDQCNKHFGKKLYK